MYVIRHPAYMIIPNFGIPRPGQSERLPRTSPDEILRISQGKAIQILVEFGCAAHRYRSGRIFPAKREKSGIRSNFNSTLLTTSLAGTFNACLSVLLNFLVGNLKVELRGIEPLIPQCHCDVIPFHYSPECS